MTTFTINLRALKAVSIAAGTEETRYYLNGVNLEHTADGLIMVATDGHRAIVLRQDWTENVPDAPFPSVIVPLAFIKKIKLAKGIDVAEITLGDNGAISIKYVGETMGTNAVAGTFPAYRQIVPKETSNEPAQYNPEYILDFGKAFALLHNAKDHNQPAICYNGQSPAIVNGYDDAKGLSYFGILMPVRVAADRFGPAKPWAFHSDAAPDEKVAPVDAGTVGLAAVEAALAD
jgi:DNA polymerase III sliding clamp (beta) subunit (PCNA family)